MKPLDTEFQTNANGTGMQTFRQIRSGVTLKGKPVYIYERVRLTGPLKGQIFGYEVVIPSLKKAGTYKLPLPKGSPKGTPNPTITYTEDFEEYPGKTKFGFSAWSFGNKGGATWKFEQLTTAPVEIEEPVETEDDETDVPAQSLGRGRVKAERPVLTLPDGEFSTKELAELNKVEYITAAVFLKEQETSNLVRRTRTERRATRGKETQLFQKIQLTGTE